MPRYFLHLRDGMEETLDPDGMEMTAEAIVQKAICSARDCMAGDVMSGRLDLRPRIDVHDESGALVHRQRFADALEIVQPLDS